MPLSGIQFIFDGNFTAAMSSWDKEVYMGLIFFRLWMERIAHHEFRYHPCICIGYTR